MTKAFHYSEEVDLALNDHRVLVALESTLISHGLPYPDNMDVAKASEQAIRNEGATPATIAVLDGVVQVGLDERHLERLSTASDVQKLSRRDLPVAVSGVPNAPILGTTTVSATMKIAEQAGIPIFATGGIGGVHRDFAISMDISADLFELSQTSVAVVCSGPKAILDLPRTREYLETAGVTVVGYRCNEMPAFWARSSGLQVDCRVENASEVADIINARGRLGIGGAVLVCNPVRPDLAIDKERIECWIRSCEKNAPNGSAATPWLLAQIAKLSCGLSLKANKQLIIDNAALAAEIASHLNMKV